MDDIARLEMVLRTAVASSRGTAGRHNADAGEQKTNEVLASHLSPEVTISSLARGSLSTGVALTGPPGLSNLDIRQRLINYVNNNGAQVHPEISALSVFLNQQTGRGGNPSNPHENPALSSALSLSQPLQRGSTLMGLQSDFVAQAGSAISVADSIFLRQLASVQDSARIGQSQTSQNLLNALPDPSASSRMVLQDALRYQESLQEPLRRSSAFVPARNVIMPGGDSAERNLLEGLDAGSLDAIRREAIRMLSLEHPQIPGPVSAAAATPRDHTRPSDNIGLVQPPAKRQRSATLNGPEHLSKKPAQQQPEIPEDPLRFASWAERPAPKIRESQSQKSENAVQLGVEEDCNWLSEMHCFLRSEIVEVFQADSMPPGTCTAKGGLVPGQIGIRCKWCAHVPADSRSCRSAAFPSSIRQLYQSFTMMVREHLGQNMCTSVPLHYRELLQTLRSKRNGQGANDSKQYWIVAARKIGMVDTSKGIRITEESKAKGSRMPPYGSPPSPTYSMASKKPTVLVRPEDLSHTSGFLYVVMQQTQVIHLEPTEQVAKRKTLPVGLTGIGCQHCCVAGRYGFSRRFPLRRRGLPEEILDLYCHLKRCTLCPASTKWTLERLYSQHKAAKFAGSPATATGGCEGGPNTEFYDVVWTRLGRTADIKT